MHTGGSVGRGRGATTPLLEGKDPIEARNCDRASKATAKAKAITTFEWWGMRYMAAHEGDGGTPRIASNGTTR